MENNDSHSRKIFWFCAATAAAGLIFLACLIWAPVPKENQPIAQIAIGFITGTVIAIPLTYLLGGNAPIKKPEVKAETVNADVVETVNTNTTNVNQ